MTTERDLSEKLTLYVDGELETTEREVLRRRIESSPELAAEVERLERTRSLVGGFFRESADAVRPGADAEREAVQRIVAESTTALRRSGITRRGKGRGGFLFAVLAGIVVVLVLVLFLRSFLTGEPSAGDLIERTGGPLASRYYEIDVRPAGVLGVLGAIATPLADLGDVSIRVGPNGLAHVRLGVEEPLHGASIEGEGGFDGTRYWAYVDGWDEVRTFATETDERFRALRQTLDTWRRLAAFIDEVRDNPELLELSGRDRADEDAEESWWKMRARGRRAIDSGTLWVDDDGRLRRVVFAGLQFDLEELFVLKPEDFRIETLKPGLPIVEGDR